MSKLNLINLAKDAISKEEAQKAKGGDVICVCECLCNCVCTQFPSSVTFNNTRDSTKVYENWTYVRE